MSGGRPRKVAPEPLLDMLRQGHTVYSIAKQLGIDHMTVHRRLSEERERIVYQESLKDHPQNETFKVEITIEYSHEASTEIDITATEGIKKAS